MRAILLRKNITIIYCATNTDSTDRIARDHKNFLKIIKLISRERVKNTFILKILL